MQWRIVLPTSLSLPSSGANRSVRIGWLFPFGESRPFLLYKSLFGKFFFVLILFEFAGKMEYSEEGILERKRTFLKWKSADAPLKKGNDR